MDEDKYNNLKKKVEYALENFIHTRNCDLELTLCIWKSFYPIYINGDNSIYLQNIYQLPREDHISRVRRKIQNDENRFLPTSWEVAKKRKIERYNWEKALGYHPNTQLEMETL